MHEPSSDNFFGMGTIGERGQIVIPAKAREELSIKPGDNFIFFGHNKMIHMVRAEELKGWLEKMTAKTDRIKKWIDSKENK